MITCLIGTPGSGKSLNMARMIYRRLKPREKYYVITNVPLNIDMIPPESRSRYRYVSNEQLADAKYLIQIATDYWEKHTYRDHNDYETRLQLFIDECQILFNSRDWQKNKEKNWPMFFSVHRHYGYNVILVTQMLSSLDKQVRGVIEYYTIHRKVSNFGLFGWALSLLFRGGLFVTVLCWAPLNQKIADEFFVYRKKFGAIYNTHALFFEDGRVDAVGIGKKEGDENEEKDYLPVACSNIDWMSKLWEA